jgi:hypothetical protein
MINGYGNELNPCLLGLGCGRWVKKTAKSILNQAWDIAKLKGDGSSISLDIYLIGLDTQSSLGSWVWQFAKPKLN